MTATDAQIRYATELQAKIREKLTYTFDRDVMRQAFLPDKDTELQAQVRQARAEGRTDDVKTLREQVKQRQHEQAEQAMDAYLARRAELAETDLTTLDKYGISAWIDDAKRHQL